MPDKAKDFKNFRLKKEEIIKIADFKISIILGKNETPLYATILKEIWSELKKKYPIDKLPEGHKKGLYVWLNKVIWEAFIWVK